MIDYHIGRTCKAGELTTTLEGALNKASGDLSRLMLRSDNGPQMTSNMFREYIADLEIGLDHEFIPPACPNKNAHVESFFSILETEFLQVRYFRDFASAYKQTAGFMDHYNNRRIHGSIGQMPPSEAEQGYYDGSVKIKEVRV